MKTLLLPILQTVIGVLRRRASLHLEILALQQQLAMVTRSAPKRYRFHPGQRFFSAWLFRLWPTCLQTLHIIKLDTVVRWHRQGFRLYWTWKSRLRRSGRPLISKEVRQLVPTMSRENVGWGAPQIYGELQMRGINISQWTVAKYMLRLRNPTSQTWRTFLDNHIKDLVSVDFFTVPTATFRILYVFVVLHHDRRQNVHFNITVHPTAAWTAQQIINAFPFDTAPRYLLRDRDGIYGNRFRSRVHSMGIEEVLTAPRSPWQSSYVVRVIGSIRRECLNHAIILNERHLKRIVRSHIQYYHAARMHLPLDKQSPVPRSIQSPDQGNIIADPHVGGVHHEYVRRAA